MIFADKDCKTLNQELDKIIVLPLGAIEQHGPHLPVGTDSHIITHLAQELAKRFENEIILCPTLSFGSSHHHIAFGGTISISANLYSSLITDLVTSILESGFRKIILLNGHGGNITPVRQALTTLSQLTEEKHPANIVLATYWEVAGKPFAGEAPMESPALSHACEYETSLMLEILPNLVHIDKIERAKRPDKNGYIAWEDDEKYRGVSIVKSTAYISDNGSSGEPQLATKDKGHHLFKSALESLSEFILSFENWPIYPKLKK